MEAEKKNFGMNCKNTYSLLIAINILWSKYVMPSAISSAERVSIVSLLAVCWKIIVDERKYLAFLQQKTIFYFNALKIECLTENNVNFGKCK